MQNIVGTSVEFQFFLDNSYEDINTDCDPDLGFHCVFGGPVKRLDSKVLFDPFEKKFHLPTAFVELGDRYSVEHKIVCQEHESFGCFGIEIADATKGIGVILRRLGTLEKDRLIASESRGLVDRAISPTSAIEISLGSNNKEGYILSKHIQAGKIDVATIENVKRARF